MCSVGCDVCVCGHVSNDSGVRMYGSVEWNGMTMAMVVPARVEMRMCGVSRCV